MTGNRAMRVELNIQGDPLRKIDIKPSTESELIKCSHYLTIELQLDASCYCGRNPEARLQIPIY